MSPGRSRRLAHHVRGHGDTPADLFRHALHRGDDRWVRAAHDSRRFSGPWIDERRKHAADGKARRARQLGHGSAVAGEGPRPRPREKDGDLNLSAGNRHEEGQGEGRRARADHHSFGGCVFRPGFRGRTDRGFPEDAGEGRGVAAIRGSRRQEVSDRRPYGFDRNGPGGGFPYELGAFLDAIHQHPEVSARIRGQRESVPGRRTRGYRAAGKQCHPGARNQVPR